MTDLYLNTGAVTYYLYKSGKINYHLPKCVSFCKARLITSNSQGYYKNKLLIITKLGS